MNRILKAIRFAELKHQNQKRKVTGDDYVCHPIYMSYIVANYKKSKHLDDLIIASLVHDSVEDTDTTYEELLGEFGIFVASLVFELTNNKEEIRRIGKLEYLKRKLSGLSNYGLYLKLCDRLCNLMDNPTQESKNDTIEILNYLEKVRVFTKSQRSIIYEIRRLVENKS